jgi:hypothetical protein
MARLAAAAITGSDDEISLAVTRPIDEEPHGNNDRACPFHRAVGVP